MILSTALCVPISYLLAYFQSRYCSRSLALSHAYQLSPSSQKRKSQKLVRKFELYPTFTKCSTVFSGSNCLTEVPSIPPQLQLRLKVFYEINSNVLSYF